MLAKTLFEEATQKFSETLANSPVKDVEKNAKALFGSVLNKMDVVTREEFNIQQQVLIKTRLKLTELEQKISELEAKLAAQEPKSTKSKKSDSEK